MKKHVPLAGGRRGRQQSIWHVLLGNTRYQIDMDKLWTVIRTQTDICEYEKIFGPIRKLLVESCTDEKT